MKLSIRHPFFSVVFSIDAKLIDFSWLVLSNLLRMVEISAYFDLEMSSEIKSFDRKMIVAIIAL